MKNFNNKQELNTTIIKMIAEEVTKHNLIMSNYDLDMHLCFIVFKDEFGYIDTYKAYIQSRYEAKLWFDEHTKNNIPYYGVCCGEEKWNRIESLLSAKSMF